jgi:hypothetical protein
MSLYSLQCTHPQMNHGSHVKALLEAGALPDAVDIYGDTALHMAVSYGYSDLIPIFVSRIDPQSLVRTLGTHNMYGQRPIDMAQVRFVPSLSPVAPAPSIPSPLTPSLPPSRQFKRLRWHIPT